LFVWKIELSWLLSRASGLYRRLDDDDMCQLWLSLVGLWLASVALHVVVEQNRQHNVNYLQLSTQKSINQSTYAVISTCIPTHAGSALHNHLRMTLIFDLFNHMVDINTIDNHRTTLYVYSLPSLVLIAQVVFLLKRGRDRHAYEVTDGFDNPTHALTKMQKKQIILCAVRTLPPV